MTSHVWQRKRDPAVASVHFTPSEGDAREIQIAQDVCRSVNCRTERRAYLRRNQSAATAQPGHEVP